MKHAANALTVIGAVLGVAGIASKNPAMLIVSLVLDAADGFVARKLKIESPEGAKLDWTVDVLLAGAMMAIIEPLMLLPLVGAQAMAIFLDLRVSGRAVITALFVMLYCPSFFA